MGDRFREFRKLCSSVAQTEVPDEKRDMIRNFFTRDFEGNLNLWLRCLCQHSYEGPYENDRLVDMFSEIVLKVLQIPAEEIQNRLAGNQTIDDVLANLFSSSRLAAKKSRVTLKEVDDFLSPGRNEAIRHGDRVQHLKDLLTKCTPNDLMIIVWMMQHELNLNVNVLAAVDPQLSRDFRKLKDLDSAVDLYVNRQRKDRVLEHFEPGQIRQFLPDFLTGVRIYLDEALQWRRRRRRGRHRCDHLGRQA